MSFLPYSGSDNGAWWGALTLSSLTHAGLGTFVFLSGSVLFLQPPSELEAAEDNYEVSFQILDAEIIDEVQPPLDDRIPEDAEELQPEVEELAALEPEDMLEPDVQDADVPEPDVMEPEILEPDLLESEAQEPEVTEPEVTEPDVTEPEVFEPEVFEPEITEPEVTEPEITEPDVAEPEVTEPEVTEPEVTEPQIAEPVLEDEPILIPEIIEEPIELAEPEPEVTEPEILEEPIIAEVIEEPTVIAPEPTEPESLEVADLLVIDEEEVINPLAEGGGSGSGPAEPEFEMQLDEILPEVLPEEEVVAAVVLPEIEVPGAGAEEVQPVALPDPEPEVAEPETQPESQPEEDPQPEPEPEVQQPEEPAKEDAEAPVAPPAAPARPRIENPSPSDIALGSLLRRIRATPQSACTLALPRRASTGVGLSLIGAEQEELDIIAAQILEGFETETSQSREIVDARQCAALDILRQMDSYPASRIGLALSSTAFASGDSLSGRVLGGQGLFLTLLLIDDNGVVQNLAPFTQLEDGVPVFDVPIARAGGPRETRQIVLAIGAPGAPLDLGGRIGQTAQEVFAPLPADVLENLVFGVATVDVR